MKTVRLKSGATERSGVAAVEMAFVFPLFMLLVLGIVEFGRYMMVGQLVTNGSREGARMAVTGYFTEAEIIQDVKDFVTQSVGVDASDVSVEIDTESGSTIADADPKELITVTVGIRFADVTYLPFLGDPAPSGSDDHFSGLRDTQAETNVITGICSMRKE